MVWFSGLSVREQRLAKFGAVLVALAIFYAFVYLPVERSIQQKVNSLNLLKEQLRMMEATEPDDQLFTSKLSIDSSFSVWLDQQMVALKIENLITRAEPIDDQTMTLWLQNAPFDTMIDWLVEVEQKYAVATKQLDVVLKDRASGLCDIRVTLLK